MCVYTVQNSTASVCVQGLGASLGDIDCAIDAIPSHVDSSPEPVYVINPGSMMWLAYFYDT